MTEKTKIKPSHTAYVVEKTKSGKDANWREVGAVWLHKDGEGFDLTIFDNISVSGRIDWGVKAGGGKGYKQAEEEIKELADFTLVSPMCLLPLIHEKEFLCLSISMKHLTTSVGN